MRGPVRSLFVAMLLAASLGLARAGSDYNTAPFVPAGDTVASTASETAFATSYTIPGGTVSVGDVIRIKLWGVYGTTVIAPTLTAKLKIGSTTVLNSGALTCTISLTNVGWSAEGQIGVVTVGGSGTMDVQGYAEFATAATTSLSVNLANASTYTIDTTVDETITVTVQWSASNAANTITLKQMLVEVKQK